MCARCKFVILFYLQGHFRSFICTWVSCTNVQGRAVEMLYNNLYIVETKNRTMTCLFLGINLSWGGGCKGIREVDILLIFLIQLYHSYMECSTSKQLHGNVHCPYKMNSSFLQILYINQRCFLCHQMVLQVHNDDEVRALFKQVQGEVPGSPIFIMKVASQVIYDALITVIIFCCIFVLLMFSIQRVLLLY